MRRDEAQQSCPGVPPPVWAQRFRSDDLDEVRSYASRIDGEHSRVAHGTGPLGFESVLLNGGTCALLWGNTELPVTIRGAIRNPVLHLGVGAGRYRIGRREEVPDTGDAMFIPAGLEFSRHGRPGSVLAIAPDPDRLLDEIVASGAERTGDILLTARRLVMSDAERQRLLDEVTGLVQASAPGPTADAAQHFQSRLVGVIATLLLQQSVVVRTRLATRARVADLESWIEANLERPITAGQLCRIAGVSKRGLEKIFETHRGMSPMRFVTERRLAAAQRLLRAAAPGDDVTRIALRLDFNHAGRFSALYRQAYGELPSQTLKDALRRRG